jgi:hypothetical protein
LGQDFICMVVEAQPYTRCRRLRVFRQNRPEFATFQNEDGHIEAMSCHAKADLPTNFIDNLLEDRIMGSTEGGDSSWKPSTVRPTGNPEQYAHLTGATEGGGGTGTGKKPPGGTEGGGGGSASSSSSASASAEAQAAASATTGPMTISAGNLRQIFIPMPNAQPNSMDSGGVDGGTNHSVNILGAVAWSKGDSRVTERTQQRRDTELVCNVGVNTGTLAGQGFAAVTEMGREIRTNPAAASTAQAEFANAAHASVTSMKTLDKCADSLVPGGPTYAIPQLTFTELPAPTPPPAPPRPADVPAPHPPVHHAPHPPHKAKTDCVK